MASQGEDGETCVGVADVADGADRAGAARAGSAEAAATSGSATRSAGGAWEAQAANSAAPQPAHPRIAIERADDQRIGSAGFLPAGVTSALPAHSPRIA